MPDRTPDLSLWENMGSDSDNEQLFYLVGLSKETVYDSHDAWAIVKLDRSTCIPDAMLPSAPFPEIRSCAYHTVRRCSLSALRNCCECSDKRPQVGSSLNYLCIDGHDWVKGATRWEYYCPGCKDYQETMVPNQTMGKLKNTFIRTRSEKTSASQSYMQSLGLPWMLND